ncbi:MAG: hypothetical protein NC420_08125 [Eubacterium sp.]|nr:hypothetical protein [Eubacterium sp.]
MCDRMYRISFRIVRTAGAAMMLLLVACALADTWYMLPGEEEISFHKWDNVAANLLAAVFCCILLSMLLRLESRLGVGLRRMIPEGIAIAAASWAFLVSIWWIFSAERLPMGDQAFIYGGASYFRAGDFSFLEQGGYCHIYPYQLGQIALVELLYHVVEPLQYRPLQVMNALAAAGIVYTGYRLVREWSGRFCTEVLYCLLISACFPLFFYAPWVYGDVLSIFLAFLSFFFLCRYDRQEKTGYLVGMILTMALAQLVRQSTTIIYMALALTALVRFFGKRDKKLLLAATISIVLSMLLFAGIYRMYEARSGIERSKGTPTVVTLAMGMQESRHGCGWDNNYQKDVYSEAVFDYEKMRETGVRELKERLSCFAQDPVYAAKFYGKKILAQWNAPLYQSVFFTADYRQSAPPKEGTLAERVSGSAFWTLLWICDRVQFVVYLGMLFWFLMAVKEKRGILRQIVAVAVIGGFCFSLLWEAKTRYILPYYLFMFPCAAVGYRESYRCLRRMLSGRKEQAL